MGYPGHMMNMHTKHELAETILPRYLKASREEKTKILDEFCANTTYDRTYASSKLKKLQQTREGDKRPVGKHIRNRERIYDSYVSAVVEQIYEVLGGVGARRMHPLVETTLEKGIKFGHIKVDPLTEMKVVLMSKSTLDRMMKKIREKNARRIKVPRFGNAMCGTPFFLNRYKKAVKNKKLKPQKR